VMRRRVSRGAPHLRRDCRERGRRRGARYRKPEEAGQGGRLSRRTTCRSPATRRDHPDTATSRERNGLAERRADTAEPSEVSVTEAREHVCGGDVLENLLRRRRAKAQA